MTNAKSSEQRLPSQLEDITVLDLTVTERGKGLYRLDEFELDVRNRRLTAGGQNCPLEPKSFRLLQFLIETRQRSG